MGSVCCRQQDQKYDLFIQKTPSDDKKPSSSKKSNNQVKLPVINSNQQKKKEINAAEKYNSLKFLGKGNFGDVVQVQEKKTLKKYAMKIIKKQNLRQFNLLQCQLIETISLKPQLVTIHEIFQNQKLVYIVMEYLPRGDIFFYNKQKIIKFQEKLIKQIVAEIIVGIGILHSYGIIYRQLKPQNLLVTDQGHIKLNDYGLSKMIRGKDLTFTYVGPMQYSAPEVMRDNYGKKVDIWAIGIIMYELRFRDTPYSHYQKDNNISIENQKINIEQILRSKKDEVSQEFYDVLLCCLKQNPEERIDLKELRLKPFFKQINWQQVQQLKNPPPFANISNEDYKFKDPNNKEIQPDRKVVNNYSKKYQASIYAFKQSQQCDNKQKK